MMIIIRNASSLKRIVYSSAQPKRVCRNAWNDCDWADSATGVRTRDHYFAAAGGRDYDRQDKGRELVRMQHGGGGWDRSDSFQ